MPKAETVECECGCVVTKNKLKRHQETKRHTDFLENPELFVKYKEIKETPTEVLQRGYAKKYYEKNKEAIVEKRKEKYGDIKDELNEKRRANYDNIKEKESERRKELTKCECGVEVRKTGLSRHIKTNKHITAMAAIKNAIKDAIKTEESEAVIIEP